MAIFEDWAPLTSAEHFLPPYVCLTATKRIHVIISLQQCWVGKIRTDAIQIAGEGGEYCWNIIYYLLFFLLNAYLSGVAGWTACSSELKLFCNDDWVIYLVCVQGLTGSSDKGQQRTDFVLTRSAQGGERWALVHSSSSSIQQSIVHFTHLRLYW